MGDIIVTGGARNKADKSALDTATTAAAALAARVTTAEGSLASASPQITALQEQAAVDGPMVAYLSERAPASKPASYARNRPYLIDPRGDLGGGAAVYVPAAIFHQRAGLTAINTNLTPAASEVSGYVKVAWADPSAAMTIYVDLAELGAGTTAALHKVTGVSGPPDDPVAVRVLGSVWARGHSLDGPALWVQDIAKVNAYPLSPLVVQRSADGSRRLFFPGFYTWRADRGLETRNFAPDAYRFFPVSGDAVTTTRVVLDWKAAIAGGEPLASIVETGGADSGKQGGFGLDVLAASLNGQVQSPFDVIVSPNDPRVGPNQFEAGRDPAGADLYVSTAATTITASALTALGFTAGVADPTNKQPFYGSTAPSGLAPKPHYYVRVLVQTDADDAYGAGPRLLIYDRDGGIVNAPMVMEERLSARAAVFRAVGRADSAAVIDRWMVGVLDSGGRTLRLTGAQACWRAEPVLWIDRLDQPDPRDAFVLPPTLWLTAGSPLAIRPEQALPVPPDPGVWSLSLASPAMGFGPAAEAVTRMGPEFTPEPARLAPKAEIVARRRNGGVRVLRAPLNVRVAPGTDTGSPVVLLIGDSLLATFVPQMVKDYLTARGLTPTFLGSVPQQAFNAAPTPGEARPGMAFADYTHERTTQLDPVMTGAEAAYLVQSYEIKATLNPFIRQSTGGDPAGRVFSGYIFDPAFYVSRFGYARPTHVYIGLGTNDLNFAPDDATAASWIAHGLDTLYGQTRAAFPEAEIAFGIHATAAPARTGRWARHHRLLLTAVNRFVRAANDPRLTLTPAYLSEPTEAGWTYASGANLGWAGGTTNADGLQTALVTDDIHRDTAGRRSAAAVIAAWIGATQDANGAQNSEFWTGATLPDGFEAGGQTVAGAVSRGWASPDFSGAVRTYVASMTGTPAAGTFDVLSTRGGDLARFGTPVRASSRVAVTWLVATHRCSAAVKVKAFDAAGAQIGAELTPTAGGGALATSDHSSDAGLTFAAGNPALAPLIGGYVDLPAGAVRITSIVRVTVSGSDANPYAFVGRPQHRAIGAGVTAPPAYKPGAVI